MPGRGERGPGGPETGADPLAAFDAALGQVREEKTASARKRKEEMQAVSERAKERLKNFDTLAKTGTWGDFKKLGFEVYLKDLAAELGKEPSGDLDAKLERIAAIKDRLERFEKLSDADRAKPELVTAADALRTEAEGVMREWASTLRDWFAELHGRSEFEIGSVDHAIREVLDSPVFSADVRMENEKYGDYKKRVVEEMGARVAQPTREFSEERAWHVVSPTDREDYTSSAGVARQMLMDLRHSATYLRKVDAKQALITVRTFLHELEKMPNPRGGDTQTARDRETLMRKVFARVELRHNFFQYFNRPLDHIREGLQNEVIAKIEQVIEVGDTVDAATRAYAEEKWEAIINRIEKEIKTEDERHAAIEWCKTHLPSWSRNEYHAHETEAGAGFVASIPFQNRPETEAPPWLLEACRQYNNLRIFQDIVKGDVNIKKDIVIDQLLRKQLGEPSFAGATADSAETEVSVQDTAAAKINFLVRFKTESHANLRALAKSETCPATLDNAVLAKAFGTLELLRGTPYFDSSWKERERDKIDVDVTFKSRTQGMAKLLNRVTGVERFDDHGAMRLYESGDKAVVRGWQEDVRRRAKAERPGAKREVADIVATEGGVYAMKTLGDAMRIVDAMRGEVVDALQRAERAEVGAQDMAKAAGVEKAAAGDVRTAMEKVRAEVEAKAAALRRLEDELRATRAKLETSERKGQDAERATVYEKSVAKAFRNSMRQRLKILATTETSWTGGDKKLRTTLAALIQDLGPEEQ